MHRLKRHAKLRKSLQCLAMPSRCPRPFVCDLFYCFYCAITVQLAQALVAYSHALEMDEVLVLGLNAHECSLVLDA